MSTHPASKPTSIRSIALIGGSGQIGSHILKHLLTLPSHTTTVLTRPDSTATFPSSPNLKTVTVDYTNEASLISALRGHDFLIITLFARAPPTLHPSIVTAASKAGIPYIMPNYYGYALDARAGDLSSDPVLGGFKRFVTDVETLAPNSAYVALVCGFWYEYSLAMGEPWLGFRIRNRSLTMYGDGTRRISTSTWEQCGRAVKALVSLPVVTAGGEAETTTVCLDDFADKGVYVSSFLISQRDILDSLHRVLGTTDADWTITYEGVEERQKRGLEEFGQGNFLGFARAMYARLFFESGEGDFETGQQLDNGKLGLPKEELDEATKRAVKMAEGKMGDMGF